MKDCELALDIIQIFFIQLALFAIPIDHFIDFHQIMFQIFLITLIIVSMFQLDYSYQIII